MNAARMRDARLQRATSRSALTAAARLAMAAAFLLSLRANARAADFYAGKTIAFIVASPAGGGYDVLARIAARFLPKHVPGSPTIVVQNMPAAAGLSAAFHIANVAPKDGTSIALLQRSVLLSKITNPTGTRFALDDFRWIASLSSETSVVLAWRTASIKNARELFTGGMTVGGLTAGDPELTAKLYNGLIGTKFNIVNGYDGTTSIGLAMERGEVDGIADWSWSSLKSQHSDWLRDKKVAILMQGALTPHPELGDTPSALSLADNPIAKTAMELYFEQKMIARPVVAPAGVPEEQGRTLVAAFEALKTADAFLSAVAQAQLEANVIAGAPLAREILKVRSAPDVVIQTLARVLAPK